MAGSDSQFDGLFGQRIASTIEKAKNGDTESARTILRWFCGSIKSDKEGKPYRKPSGPATLIDERILRYLGECFQKILDKSHAPDVALGLKKPPHREADSSIATRNEDMALDMARQIHGGAPYKVASLNVAELWKNHASFKKAQSIIYVQDSVRKAYERRKDVKLFQLKVKLLRNFEADFWEKRRKEDNKHIQKLLRRQIYGKK